MSGFSRQVALVAAIAFTAGAAGFWVARLMPPPAPEVASVSPRKPAPVSGLEGQPAPALSLPDLDGKPRSLSDWPGKWLMVNFWATWCAPCMHEIPALVAAQTKYEKHGLQILGIAMDDPDAVRTLMREKGFNYPSLVGDEQVQHIMEQFGNTMGALPYTVLIAPDGVIRYIELGGVDTPKLDMLMQRFLPL
ncbi:MAG: TlpA disulfide reductase family protein [Stagnimonas sp.]|nr:TlpA disulfide reductase family protein [Stagnimonas sp.]